MIGHGMILKLLITLTLLVWTENIAYAEVTRCVEYDEPTTNADKSPLTDLSYTIIYAGILPPTNNVIGELYQLVKLPATSQKGGGHIRHEVIIPITYKRGMTLLVFVQAVDFSGNVSDIGIVKRRIYKQITLCPK